MSAWPESMKVGPIGVWPGELTAQRRPSPFSAKITDTLRTLTREIYELAVTRAHQDSAEVLIAIPASRFRLDGKPYADAKPEHPGVIFSMETRFGRVSYPCDTFTTWQDNLRAIALALEALRKVDRYGVTRRGEQYRGFLALESATAMPSGFATAHDAQAFIRELGGYDADETWTPRVFRDAQRKAHPDLGGDAATFQRVSLAEAKLREAGLL